MGHQLSETGVTLEQGLGLVVTELHKQTYPGRGRPAAGRRPRNRVWPSAGLITVFKLVRALGIRPGCSWFLDPPWIGPMCFRWDLLLVASVVET